PLVKLLMGAANILWITNLLWTVMGSSNDPYWFEEQNKASVFADLSPQEISSVQNFLMEKKNLNLVLVQETIDQNVILMIELKVPPKKQVLNFLDNNGPMPQREAKVVILFGDQANPNVTELIVGPLPNPRYYRPYIYQRKKEINFESRPLTKKELEEIDKKVFEITTDFDYILLETSGFSFHNCSDRCLAYNSIAPQGLKSGERRTWFQIMRSLDGFYLHPIGIEFLLNFHSLNPKDWLIEIIFYNGQYFDGVDDFITKYNRKAVRKFRLPPYENNFSTYIPRGHYKTSTNIHGPSICENEGKRYKVVGNYVAYTGWSFAYRIRTSAGIQLFDIKYNNERIVYELSLQEALAFYSGVTPCGSQTKYLDSGWGMGSVSYEMVKGIDCPEYATFLDVYHFYDTNKPIQHKNALCIFELPTGIPLRRHHESDYEKFKFYGGVPNNVLVLRTISTVDNYDYIWDFIFYQNGVIETKVSATGYMQTTFFTPDGTPYGSRVNAGVLGNLHTHMVHYKVDLDIAGTENNFETVKLQYENISNPWSPGDFIVQKRMVHTQITTEKKAAFSFGDPFPSFLMFQNPLVKNKWGSPKTYRIQYNSNVNSVLPKGWKEENGVTWSRYVLAVTRQNESEVTSSSIYNQNDPWDPVVRFEDFIENNDNIIEK
ncbi:hypothetical protein GDO86_019836, partial [Hymenochirus boettgeri]